MLKTTTCILLLPSILHAQEPHVLDGRFDDWAGVAPAHEDDAGMIRAVRVSEDPHFVHLQIDLDAPRTLQGLSEELRIELNLDGRDSTGFTGLDGLEGTDGIVAFSPLDGGKGTSRSGSAVFGADRTGATVERTADVLGVVALPTHGSRRFEIRLDRLPAFRRDGFQVQVIARTADGITDKSPVIEHEFDTKDATRPREVVIDPAEPIADGRYRVMSWNGEYGALFKNPGPFARTFEAMNPDIVFLQELPGDTTTAALARWFDRLDGDRSWTAAVSGQHLLVGVVTPHTYESVPELARVMASDPRGTKREIRAVGGLVTIGTERILAVSVHLKCCGRMGSSEDEKRGSEVEAIREAVREATRRLQPDSVVIGGDLNLVGTPAVLERLCEGLATDGSDLVVADPMRPAGDANTTWEKAGQAFVPGRLDFILASSNATVERAVVLDTRQMTDRWRRRHSIPLEAPSDHLAIAVDLACEGCGP